MADINDKDSLTAKQATKIIHEIVRFGNVIPGPHCLSRMSKKEYDTNDLEKILSEGIVKKQPEFNKAYRNWKCEVEGYAIEGDLSVVVTAIVSHREIFCITIFSKE